MFLAIHISRRVVAEYLPRLGARQVLGEKLAAYNAELNSGVRLGAQLTIIGS